MSVVGLGDGQTILVGRAYLARVTGAESVRTSRFAAAMLAAGFRRAGGFLRGAALDPADFRVTQLQGGAYATELVFERDREESVRETRAAIAIAVWQSGGGRPSAVEVGESRPDAATPGGEEPSIPDLIGQGLDAAKTFAQFPLYLAVAAAVGFGIYLYATSK